MPVNPNTLTLSLSKGEDGNVEMAFAELGTVLSARADGQSSAAAVLS